MRIAPREARRQAPGFSFDEPADRRLVQPALPVDQERLPLLAGADREGDLGPLFDRRLAGAARHEFPMHDRAGSVLDGVVQTVRHEGRGGLVLRGQPLIRRADGAAHGVFCVGQCLGRVAIGTAFGADIGDAWARVE